MGGDLPPAADAASQGEKSCAPDTGPGSPVRPSSEYPQRKLWYLLPRIGLGYLATGTENGVVAAAARLAWNVQALRDLRLSMRERLLASPLLDVAGLVRRLERAYREVWVR